MTVSGFSICVLSFLLFSDVIDRTSIMMIMLALHLFIDGISVSSENAIRNNNVLLTHSIRPLAPQIA